MRAWKAVTCCRHVTVREQLRQLLKIACDLVDEGMRTEEEAVAMIDPRNLDTLLHPQFDAAALKAATPMAKALGASPGAACGKIVFTAEDAVEWACKRRKSCSCSS